MWGVTPESGNWNWDELKTKIMDTGIRNSLLLAPMPTASTSQILGNNECFEAFTSNLYTRRTLSGEFVILNKHLVNDLIEQIIIGLKINKIVKIHNFGTFKLRKKNARIGRNPKTKEEVMIAPRNVISFLPSKHILKKLNDYNVQ